jgi:hypothetical protein
LGGPGVVARRNQLTHHDEIRKEIELDGNTKLCVE